MFIMYPPSLFLCLFDLTSCLLAAPWQLSAEEEDKRISAMGGGKSRLKFKQGDQDDGEGDSW